MDFQDCIVVVGTGAGNQDDILAVLRHNGYSVLPVRDSWPRDHYLLSSSSTINVRANGEKIDWLAEGGFFRLGKDVVLASDLCQISDIAVFSSFRYFDMLAVTKEKIEKSYPGMRAYVLPSGYFHGGKMHAHLDMFTLYLPEARLLVVDAFDLQRQNPSSLFSVDSARRMFESFATEQDISLIWYDSSQDKVWWPLNAAVLPAPEGGELVVLDEACFTLRNLLENYAVPYLGVPCLRINNPGGKINCATNTLSKSLLAERGENNLLEELSLEALIHRK